MRTALYLLLATIGMAVGAPAAVAQSCTDVYPVIGLIKDEFFRLNGEHGPLGCPLALEEKVLNREGGFQEFKHGQIAWSPESGREDATVTAYYKEDCTPDSGACIVFRWRNMPDSDVFIVRLADQEHFGLVDKEPAEGQFDVVVATSQIDISDPEDPGFNPEGRVFRSYDETLGQNSGSIGVLVDRFQAGRYKFTVKACTRDSVFLGIGEDTECPYQWSNTVYVDYEFLDLRAGLLSGPTSQTADVLFAERRNAAMTYACRRAKWLDGDEAGGNFGSAALALLGNEQVPLFGSPAAPLFSCSRSADNLTKYDTAETLAGLSPNDPILDLVNGDCDYGLPGVPALENECVVGLALRGLRQKKVVGTNMQVLKEDGMWGKLTSEFPDFIGDRLACPTQHGDYDFELLWILRIMLVHGPYPIGDDRIDETTWKHLLTLLSVRGTGSFDHIATLCGVPLSPETENHTWMIEAARYLTNEILTLDALRHGDTPDPQYDNQSNGQEKLILKQLSRLLIEDFYEFNSRPYQGLTVSAIRNLYEVGQREGSKADRVAKAAEVVLDYLSGRFVLSSSGLRRVANFRRQPHRASYGMMFQALGDQEMPRLELLTGTSYPLSKQRFGRAHPYDSGSLIFHGTGRIYRVPQIIADYSERDIRNNFAQEVLQRFRSRGGHDDGGLEIHFSTPRFTLSAGGVFVRGRLGILGRIFGSEESSVLPTTLLLAQEGRGWQEMLRFRGAPKEDHRYNTCVGPNFACGIDPVIPSTIPEACIHREGKWTFFNFNLSTPDCRKPYGVHVAMWQGEPCEVDDCSLVGRNWGLMEVEETPVPTSSGAARIFEEVSAFAQFRSTVIQNNEHNEPDWDQPSVTKRYDTTKKTKITFQATTDPQHWSITSINGSGTPSAADWPIAQGDVMNGMPEQACIEFDNANQSRRLILDLRETSDDPATFKCEVSLRELNAEGRPKGCWMPDPCD